MTQCTLNFCLQQTSDVHEVVQLHMLNWSPDGSCSNLNTITCVIREMIDIQMKTGNHSIVVHCRCKHVKHVIVISSIMHVASWKSLFCGFNECIRMQIMKSFFKHCND